ncbi:DUF1569 domain-containing protein [Spongiimicrobium salis]|uniref:DUF1569 domain-containing protein n=1 Tax=Spongiimicrobium salis TaxID=1667022 RepID=UPI00374C9758
MKSIFEEATHEELRKRIEHLNEGSSRQWGKMTVGQMAWHCKFPLKIGLENKIPSKKPNPLIIFFFKKSMYNEKPFRKNLPTSPMLKTKEPKDIQVEKKELLDLVSSFHALKEKKDWNPHPVFGKLTPEQWGIMQYKHLDHHLTQFNV